MLLLHTKGAIADNRCARIYGDLMRGKCARGEIAKSNAAVGAVVVSQPAWLQIDNITDGIDSYASFEDQADN